MIGQGGRVPPNRVIDNDSTGDVDTNPIFDPQQDGIDFHESVEGMLLQFNNAVATGPSNDFGEVSIVGDDGRNAGLRTRRGGVIVAENDFNPERFILDDVIGETPSTANVGDKFSTPIVAVGDYSFDNFKYYPLTEATATGALQREVTETPKTSEMAVATFNVENLAPNDPPAKFAALARTLIDNLKSPDLLAIEEIQDNDGTTGGTGSPVVDASVTWNLLIAAIAAPAGRSTSTRRSTRSPTRTAGRPAATSARASCTGPTAGWRSSSRPGGTSTNSTEVVRTRRTRAADVQPGADRADRPGVHHQPQAARRRVHVEGQDGHRDRQPLQLQGRRPAAVRALPAARAGHGDPAPPAGDDRQRLRA